MSHGNAFAVKANLPGKSRKALIVRRRLQSHASACDDIALAAEYDDSWADPPSVEEKEIELLALMVCASLTAVDGDTVKCDGQNLRDMGDGAPSVSGYDTPEIGSHAHCDQERALGKVAKRRMAQLLLTPGLTVEDSGEIDRFDRPLVVLRLPDGRTIGSVMLAEGLAVEWRPGGDFDWCR